MKYLIPIGIILAILDGEVSLTTVLILVAVIGGGAVLAASGAA